MQHDTILRRMTCNVAFTYKIRKSAQWHIIENSVSLPFLTSLSFHLSATNIQYAVNWGARWRSG